MGVRSYYLETHHFMLNKFTEELDDQSLAELIKDINEKTQGTLDLRELSDARELKSVDNLSVEGTISGSKEEVNRPQSLLAILVPEFNQQIYGMAQLYKSFSEGTREAVEIFTDFNEALSWLARDSNEKEVLIDFVNANS